MGENQGANDTYHSSLLDKNEGDQITMKTHLHKVFFLFISVKSYILPDSGGL